MPTRLVFVTQTAHPADPTLGATAAKVTALAARVDEVVVLALRPGEAAEAGPVRVRSFGSRTKAGRALRFEAALAAELRRRPAAVLAHMCPIYAVLAAPLARPLGAAVGLWFTHWRRSPTLRLAERLADVVLSVDERSFPLPSRKLRATGHGIDLREFPCSPLPPEGPLRVLALGRYSPAKGLPVVLRGLRAAVDRGVDATLAVHGPALTPAERAHRGELEGLVAELALGERVTLGGPVPRGEVAALLAGADVLVNNMRAGAPDKVAYEAAAACRVVLASNPVFDELLGGLEPGLSFAREDPQQVAERLAAVAAVPPARRAELGSTLRARVEARHSVETWADGVLDALGVA